MSPLPEQVATLFLLALPIACVAWTVTHEEVFREPREYCVHHSRNGKTIWQRKFFYLFTCEYCFSHYVTILFLFITRYHLLYPDWRGYLIGGFALVWMANCYMSLFARLRVGMKKEKMQADIEEVKLKEVKEVASIENGELRTESKRVVHHSSLSKHSDGKTQAARVFGEGGR